MHGLRTHLHRLTTPAPQHGVLPWENPLPATIPARFPQHITTTTEMVNDRIHELTSRALNQQPTWLSALGTAPSDPARAKMWLHSVSVAAAYRDQYQITLDRADQPLGAYIPEHSAAHDAYLHAANAVLAARHPDAEPLDAITARITADIYQGLPDAQRLDVAHAVVADLGADWLGPRHGDADTLLSAPVYATHLHAEMARRGLLTDAPQAAALPQTVAPPATQLLLEQPIEQAQPEPDITVTW